MSRVVQTSRGLKMLADALRTRHDEHVCSCPCTGDCAGAQPQSAAVYPQMDARDRKWAAQKLLRPIEDKTGYEDFAIKDWIEVAREHWKLRMAGHAPQESVLERFKFSARQLRHTTAHARAVWGLSGAEEAIEDDDAVLEGDYDIDLTGIDIDTDDDDETYDAADLFDWDVSDIEVSYSSDPDDVAPHGTFRDAAGKKVNLY
jgi:hypothetical protein